MNYQRFFQLIIVFVLITVASCKNKSCEGVVCGFNQQCAEGKCYCADGYEGTGCADEAYKKYVRAYFVQENCQGSPANTPPNSTVTISQGNFLNRLYINGFLGSVNIQGIIRTDQANKGNTLEIPRQNSGGITVEGWGIYNPANGRIVFELNYIYNGINYSCSQTFYPQ